jgi:hypothetical protein
VALVDPSLVKNLISQWILVPNFLSSSRQFEKNFFIKSCLVHLISSGLYNPNDCHVAHHAEKASNNLFSHCIALAAQSRTAYQMELIYDLTRTLIQYGADPNLDPYQFQAHGISLSSNQMKQFAHNRDG